MIFNNNHFEFLPICYNYVHFIVKLPYRYSIRYTCPCWLHNTKTLSGEDEVIGLHTFKLLACKQNVLPSTFFFLKKVLLGKHVVVGLHKF